MTKDKRKLRHQTRVNQRHTEEKDNEKENDASAEMEKKVGEKKESDDGGGASGSGSAPKQQRERIRDRRRPVAESPQQPIKSKEDDDDKKPKEVKSGMDEAVKEENESGKRYAKRQIFSNWEQYDLPSREKDEEEESLPAADFSELLNAPFSEGGHFRFKMERSWDEDRTAFCSEFFSLDLQQLASGLLSIPFYKRIGVPIEYFREEEIDKMEEESKKHLEIKLNTNTNVQRVLDILTEPSRDQVYLENDTVNVDQREDKIEAVWALTEDPSSEETLDEFAEMEASDRMVFSTAVPNDKCVAKATETFDFGEELRKSREGTPNVEGQERTPKTRSREGVPDAKSRERTPTCVAAVVEKDSCEAIPVRTVVNKEIPTTSLPNSKERSRSSADGDDDLDFLLTLKEPVAETRVLVVDSDVGVEKDLLEDSKEESDPVVLPSTEAAPKTQSLEDWLDTILDD